MLGGTECLRAALCLGYSYFKGELVTRNNKGPPEQSKHFRHDDHEHAAHQQEASRGHERKRGGDVPEKEGNGHTSSPRDTTPRGPSKGQ